MAASTNIKLKVPRMGASTAHATLLDSEFICTAASLPPSIHEAWQRDVLAFRPFFCCLN